MNTKEDAQSGFLDSRALIILLLCAVTSSVVAGSLVGLFRAEAPTKDSCNTLTLENELQRPLTAEQLQAEMDRIAQHTKQPEVLRELFAALGNDPFVIA